MAKFSQIAKGTSARKVVSLPMGKTSIPVALVPLDFRGEASVIERAREFAKARGVPDAKAGDPLYERGIMLYTVLASAMDADVTASNAPFFDGEEEAMGLDPDRIAYLFHLQRDFQAQTAPPPRGLGSMEFLKHVLDLVEADEEGQEDVPFDFLPRGTQRRFTRALARQFSIYFPLKSLFGSVAVGEKASSGTSSGSSAEPTTPQPSSPSLATAELTLSDLNPQARDAIRMAATEERTREGAAGDAESGS